MAIRIAGGHLVDTLGKEVPQGVGDIRRMSLVPYGSRKAFSQANVALYDAP
jgi:hypothetical protein